MSAVKVKMLSATMSVAEAADSEEAADAHNRWTRQVLANRDADSADSGAAETIAAYAMTVSS